MAPQDPRVTIEFEGGAAERIAGRLLDEHGSAVSFEGWLGLATVLQRFLAPAGEPEAAVTDRREVPN